MPLKTRILSFVATLGVGAIALAQSAPQNGAPGEFRITPFSDLSPEWVFGNVAESPNGRFYLMSTGDGTMMRFDRKTGWKKVPEVKYEFPAWSPNGRFIAYNNGESGIRGEYVWLLPMDTSTGLPGGTPRRVSTSVGVHATWSPDGRRVAFLSLDSAQFRVITVPFNGGDEDTLYTGRGGRRFMRWSPDGEFIYVGMSTTRPPNYLRINARTRRVDTLSAPGNNLLGVSSDGRVAYGNTMSNTVEITRVQDGAHLKTIRLPRNMNPAGWTQTSPNTLIGLQPFYPTRLLRVSLPDGAITEFTPIDSAGLRDPKYSPDGKVLALLRVASTDATLRLMDANGRNVRDLARTDAINVFAWSPSGAQIAYLATGANGGVRIVDVASGKVRELVKASGNAQVGGAIVWRRDGQAVRYMWRPGGGVSGTREVREVTLDGVSRILAQATIPAGDLQSIRETQPHFANDTLLLLRNGEGVGAVNLRTGATRQLYSGKMRPRNEFGVSKDGNWIAFAAWEGDKSVPTLVSLSTGEVRRVPFSLGAELGPVLFHPDGRHLVAPACLKCSIEKFDIVMIPMNGDPTRVLTSSLSQYVDFWHPTAAPDGRSMIFYGDLSWSSRLVTLTLPNTP